MAPDDVFATCSYSNHELLLVCTLFFAGEWKLTLLKDLGSTVGSRIVPGMYGT